MSDNQYNAKASFDVGDVPVEVGADGVGIDTERLQDRMEHAAELKARSWVDSCMTQIAVWIFLGFLFLGIAAFGAYAVYRIIIGDPIIKPPETATTTTSAPKAPTAVSWSGAEPLVCSGNKSMQVSGVTANLPGQTAIEAKGNCQLTIENSNVTGAVGIKAGGNAKVIVRGGALAGSTAAVDAGGKAEVQLIKTKVTGKRTSSASARVVEKNR